MVLLWRRQRPSSDHPSDQALHPAGNLRLDGPSLSRAVHADRRRPVTCPDYACAAIRSVPGRLQSMPLCLRIRRHMVARIPHRRDEYFPFISRCSLHPDPECGWSLFFPSPSTVVTFALALLFSCLSDRRLRQNVRAFCAFVPSAFRCGAPLITVLKSSRFSSGRSAFRCGCLPI